MLARRERHWADEYLNRVLAATSSGDRGILNSYRYGRALARIGDDESAKRIETFLATQKMRPNVGRSFPFALEEGEVEIQIPGRSLARARVFGSHWSSRSTARLVIGGCSEYPAKPPEQAKEGSESLVDIVADIICDSGVSLTAEDTERVNQRLQAVLEGTQRRISRNRPESDTGKRACQEAALVAHAIAAFLPPTFPGSMALWRIADSVLREESLELPLSCADLATFGGVARDTTPESADELPLWIESRARPIQSGAEEPQTRTTENE